MCRRFNERAQIRGHSSIHLWVYSEYSYHKWATGSQVQVHKFFICAICAIVGTRLNWSHVFYSSSNCIQIVVAHGHVDASLPQLLCLAPCPAPWPLLFCPAPWSLLFCPAPWSLLFCPAPWPLPFCRVAPTIPQNDTLRSPVGGVGMSGARRNPE